MRLIGTQPLAPTAPPRPSAAVRGVAGSGSGLGAGAMPLSFGAWLNQALARLEATQAAASGAARQLAAGQSPDLAQVMITSEQATIALQLTVAVRNKVLEAYQEIMRMPL